MSELEHTGESCRLAEALACLGDTLRVRGQHQQAENVLRRAARLADNVADPLVRADVLNSLGILCKDTGRYEEADRHYRHARTLLEASDSGPRALASVWHNLAGLAYARGAYADGEQAARRAIDMREAAVGRDTPDVAADRAVLAVLVAAQGRLDEAEALHQRALAIFRRAYGPEHYEVAVNLNGLAALRQQGGDHQAAEQLQRAALAIKERALGTEHPEVATLLNNLAVSLAKQDRRGEATACYQRAIDIFEAALGRDHPSAVACRDNYTRLLGDAGGEKDAPTK